MNKWMQRTLLFRASWIVIIPNLLFVPNEPTSTAHRSSFIVEDVVKWTGSQDINALRLTPIILSPPN